MKNGIIIADTGPIISLALVDKLNILQELFDEVKIAKAVWEELTSDKNKPFISMVQNYFKDKVCEIKSFNDLIFLMDYGESESVLLYQELEADFLLIDDKKARKIAEQLHIRCVGTLGLLMIAKDKKIINELRPIFLAFLKHKRFYSLELLNNILQQKEEDIIKNY